MKRDIDLIRKILLHVEQEQKGEDRCEIHLDQFEGYSKAELKYNIKLLMSAGYLDYGDVTTHDWTTYQVGFISWDGHEFLDSVRSDGVWSDVKKKLSNIGGEVPIDLIKMLAVESMKGLLNLPGSE